MAEPERRAAPDIQPPGVEGEGLDPYPTYRNGPTVPHAATSSKPTDVDLPLSQRTNQLPMLIGLIASALVVIGFIVWKSVQSMTTSDEGLTPPESPPAAEAAATSDESQIRQVRPDAQAGPGEIGETPGPVDVPGGGTP